MCCKCGGGSTGSGGSDVWGSDYGDEIQCEYECECDFMDDACWDACIECLDAFD